MINSFKSFLVEEEKTAFFTFGRMNPPTIGHEKLLNALSTKASKNPYRIFLSQSEDKKKNPLKFLEKVKIARKMFPKHARSIMSKKKIRNVFDVAVQLHNEGFKNITMVVGSDRVREFEVLLKKYNGQKGRHGLYNFQKINVISAGDRDPDADGASGMSASKMRNAASSNDFTSFSQGLPRNVPNPEAKKIFNTVRKGMGLKEEHEFKRHIQLEPVSETRENYINGKLFKIGDTVVDKKTGELVELTQLGANYIIVESEGKAYRKWLHDVELYEGSMYKDKPDWGTPESTKKAKSMTPGQKNETAAYHKGVSKSTADKRKAHFKRNAKKADNDASAYKPAPGDATAKTKTSVHTKRFKAMFGDDVDHVKIAKQRIDREKEADQNRHKRMMARAKMRDVKNDIRGK